MPSYNGAMLPSGRKADPAYVAPGKCLPPPIRPYTGAAASGPSGGSLIDRLPVTELPQSLAGIVVRQFEQHWYHRIHIRPGKIALGNLLSTQVRQVEVWNAHWAPQTLSAIERTGDGGIALSAASNPPTVFGMLESRRYDAAIGLDGPPVIDAAYTFHFDTETPVLAISGRRVVVFGLSPHWGEGWLERLSWATDLMVARDGSEQRVSLRPQARRTLEYTVLAGRDDAALLDILLAAWQSRVYALPIWPDRSVLASALSAGSMVVPVNTTNLEYEADGLLVIGSDSRNTEAAEILSVAPTTVTLKQALLQTWPAGAFIVPARTARLRTTQALSRVTDSIVSARLLFDLTTSGTVAAQDSATLFGGVPVWLAHPHRERDIDVEYRRLAEVLDFETGIVAVDDSAARPWLHRVFEYRWVSRAEIASFKAWLMVRAGRRSAFWMPSWEASLIPIKKVLSNQTVLSVAARGYALYFNPLPGRSEVAFLHKNGNWYFRSILGFGAGSSADEELMSFDQSFGFDANPEDWVQILFLERMRLDSDQIELRWQTDRIVDVALPLRSVKA